MSWDTNSPVVPPKVGQRFFRWEERDGGRIGPYAVRVPLEWNGHAIINCERVTETCPPGNTVTPTQRFHNTRPMIDLIAERWAAE
jgi:hypothetical protein